MVCVTEQWRKNTPKKPSVYLCTIFRLELQVSTGMVIVMMGVQYISQVLVSLFQCIYDRHSLRRVHNSNCSSINIMQDICIVISKARYLKTIVATK
jgi:hypothetical protein